MTSDEPPVTTELDALPRRSITGEGGVSYLELRSRLTPRWSRLWLRFLAGHTALAAVAIAVVALDPEQWSGAVATAVVAGAALGFWLHYLVLFQHEAAHFNLAPSRALNELLANVLIGVLIGESIASYRRVHLAHHRYLGTPRDTERSYFEPLDGRLLAECLTGMRPIRVLFARARLDRGVETPSGSRLLNPTVIGAVAINAAIVIGSIAASHPVLAAAWVLGLVVFLPLYNTVRQVLEHRSLDADRSIDYGVVAHGPVNRLFGSGPLASTLGGAGFNRHLLHHWDPGISCTRLPELEAFLLGTVAGPSISAASTSYAAVFRRLAFHR